MKASILLAGCLLILGCRAQMVETRKRTRGPVPEVGLIDPGGGRLRYALKGPKFLLRARRQDAFRKMAKLCGGEGRVRIEREYDQDDSETPYHVDDINDTTLAEGSGHYKVESYHHIHFRGMTDP